jgi:hypothetical protein
MSNPPAARKESVLVVDDTPDVCDFIRKAPRIIAMTAGTGYGDHDFLAVLQPP